MPDVNIDDPSRYFSDALEPAERFARMAPVLSETAARTAVMCARRDLYDRCVAAERERDALAGEVARLRAVVADIPDIILNSGKPGPGGVDVTGGIPSEIYIGIGRQRYEDDGGEYELARDTADAVRAQAAAVVRLALARPAAATPRPLEIGDEVRVGEVRGKVIDANEVDVLVEDADGGVSGWFGREHVRPAAAPTRDGGERTE